MICRRERREETVPSAGVFRCHIRVLCPKPVPNDRRDEKAGAPMSASTTIEGETFLASVGLAR
jgi:hypothetical protein